MGTMVGATGMTIPREEYFAKELSFTLSRSYGPGRYDKRYEEGGNDYPIDYVRFTEQRNMRVPAVNPPAFSLRRAPIGVQVVRITHHES